jgi:hypothetical protein
MKGGLHPSAASAALRELGSLSVRSAGIELAVND